jgi:translocator protein
MAIAERMPSPLASGLTLALCVALCLGVGALGASWTETAAGSWYDGLEQPRWDPPDWLFGPVWTALYIAMAVAAWLVWRARGLAGAALPLALFALQLALNLGWTFVFFALEEPGWAFVEIVVLWFAIAATLVAFWRVTRPAGALLVPYLGWVTYAAALNFEIWRLN